MNLTLSRRTILKGLAASAAALVLPPSLTDNAEAAKRFWALDSTMLGPEPDWGMFGPYNSGASFGQWAEAYDTIDVSDASGIRRGDLIRIVDFVDGKAVVADPPEELMVVTAIHVRDDTFSFTVRR
jgi:hypothetical protein